MMEAADLNRSQATVLEQSSKSLHEQMGLRTQIGKVHEEVQRFMRSIQTRKSMSTHQYDADKGGQNFDSVFSAAAATAATESVTRSAAPATSRVHVSRRGSITMDYAGVDSIGSHAAAAGAAASDTLDPPREDASGQLSGMFDTVSNKLQGMMGTASRRPQDLVVPPVASNTLSGRRNAPVTARRSTSRASSRPHSRAHSRASSPVQTAHPMSAELRVKFADRKRRASGPAQTSRKGSLRPQGRGRLPWQRTLSCSRMICSRLRFMTTVMVSPEEDSKRQCRPLQLSRRARRARPPQRWKGRLEEDWERQCRPLKRSSGATLRT